MRLRNRFTGEILEPRKAPLSGAHVIRRGTIELHRGNEATAQAWLENLLEHGVVWEVA